MLIEEIVIISIAFALVCILCILFCIQCYITLLKQQNKSNVRVAHFNDTSHYDPSHYDSIININIDRIIKNEDKV